MTAIILIALYILGCVLAYGRIKGDYKELEEDGVTTYITKADRSIILYSWIGFVFMTYFFFFYKRKYFIKF